MFWILVVILAQPAAPPEPAARVYRTVDGAELKLYVFKPSTAPTRPAPALLLFHGGGWSAGAADWTFANARRYADAGLVTMSVQYRLSDDRVTPIDALADVCAAFQWVRAHANEIGVDARRVGAHGVSAGGHLAASAATIGCGNTEGEYRNGGPDALVLWSPAVDVSRDGHFRRILLGRADVAAYSPVEHVRSRMPPTHIVQGDSDTLTPPGGARRFCERVKTGGGQCEIALYPGVGHLLTRNLANQESDFDPDPAARDDGHARQVAFVKSLWMRD
jgi:acetyl esterase/lipase